MSGALTAEPFIRNKMSINVSFSLPDIAIADLKSHKTPRRIITKTREMYNIACVMCGVVPLRQYVKQCSGRYVNLSNVMLSAQSIKPIAISLVVSTS